LTTKACAVGVAAITTLAVLAAAPSSAAPADPVVGHHVSAGPATSVALMDAGSKKAAVVSGLLAGPPQLTRALTSTAPNIRASAITADGNTGLIGNETNAVIPVEQLRTSPAYGSPIDLSAFKLESNADSHLHSQGLALGPDFALVASGEQGVVQLVRAGSTWKVDSRVHSAGQNAVGKAHPAGFIALPTPDRGNADYNSVAIAPRPLPNGHFLAVAIDRGLRTVAVIEGVGTATPKVLGTLTNHALDGFGDFTGSGAMAFVPTSADRVILGTATGVAVLDLQRPAKPKLQAATRLGPADGVTALAVAPDGNHAAVGIAGTTYLLKGLVSAAAKGRALRPAGSITLSRQAGEDVQALAYTSNGVLSVEHSNSHDGVVLTLVKAATTRRPVAGSSLAIGTATIDNDSLSVWPTATRPAFAPGRLLTHGRVGHRVRVRLAVTGGVGGYRFAVTRGKLAPGLKLRGSRVVGTLRKATRRKVTITATNPFGATISKKYKETVRRK
jgi:hypothetical protein